MKSCWRCENLKPGRCSCKIKIVHMCQKLYKSDTTGSRHRQEIEVLFADAGLVRTEITMSQQLQYDD